MIFLFQLAEFKTVTAPQATSVAGTGVDWAVIALALLACLVLLMRKSRGPRRDGKRQRPNPRSGKRKRTDRRRLVRNPILIDGSNVMHWQDNTPQLAPLLSLIANLQARGFSPGVVFDANAGWKLFDRFMDERAFAQVLSLPADQVLVVPKGTQADAYILETAREFQAKIVTNDRYRDWVGSYPEVADPEFLIWGGVKDGNLWLKSPDLVPAKPTVLH